MSLTTESVIRCECGCGQSHDKLPPGAFLTWIGGWHRVRIKTANDIDGTTEIGCDNDPAKAVAEAWEWWFKEARRMKRMMKKGR